MDLPFETHTYPKVVVFKGKVYIGGGFASSDMDEQTVILYDPQLDACDTLPPYVNKWFSMGVLNSQLVLVGGVDVRYGKRTKNLGVWNEQSRQWTHPLPPMTTACDSPSVATHNNRWLVVIGGENDRGTALSRVEILDSESRQWYHAVPLPNPYCHSDVSLATIDNTCYLLGGFTTGGHASQKVFSVHLDNLIIQAVSESQQASTSVSPTLSPWQTLPDTPLIFSAALAISGILLAVGGGSGSKDIYHYQPSSRSWIKAGELPTRRSQCACAVLPSGEVFLTGTYYASQQVHIASLE